MLDGFTSIVAIAAELRLVTVDTLLSSVGSDRAHQVGLCGDIMLLVP